MLCCVNNRSRYKTNITSFCMRQSFHKYDWKDWPLLKSCAFVINVNATFRFSYLCKSFILLFLLINSCVGLPIQQPNKDGINKDFISKIYMLAWYFLPSLQNKGFILIKESKSRSSLQSMKFIALIGSKAGAYLGVPTTLHVGWWTFDSLQ